MPDAPPLDVRGRPFKTGIARDQLAAMQRGVLNARYRGVPFVKCPYDVMLYLQLLEKLKPATIIEIGSWQGGSAVWFADMLTVMGLQPRILSLDINPPQIRRAGVQFLRCDARNLGSVLQPTVLESLPRPWLVTEDSAHTFEVCYSTLKFFDPHLRKGEYIIIEDGVLSDLADLGEAAYVPYDHGPNRAVKKFLEEPDGAKYEIDVALVDHFGPNMTYNPNGYLQRIA